MNKKSRTNLFGGNNTNNYNKIRGRFASKQNNTFWNTIDFKAKEIVNNTKILDAKNTLKMSFKFLYGSTIIPG